MMKTEYSNWRKLDNAATAFPLVTDKDDTRVFRFYCQLKEEADGEVLQQALDETMKQYPLFQAVLRKGLFWFYLEHRELRPMVKEESKPPCSRLYIPDKKSLLFEVSYYKNRINFEVYHALTDGTGAMHFLQTLVQNYLMLRYPEAHLPRVGAEEETVLARQEEDSFSKYYSAEKKDVWERKPAAVRLGGERLTHENMHITEFEVSVKEIHARAREYGVSITVFVTAAMLWAIHEEVPSNKQKRPIALMVPVNLRNYFPSQSMANFFGWIEVGHTFTDETKFIDVINHVKEQFESELVKEKIAAQMNGFVRLERNPFLRAVPLEIKRGFLIAGANLGSRSVTAVYSNIGVVRFPEIYQNYIEHFGFFTSTGILQLCSCSFGDRMVFGFTSKLAGSGIEQNFQKRLREENVPCIKMQSDFPGCGAGQEKAGRKIFQVFTFLCIAAAVISGMVNYLAAGRLDWALFAQAGCLCCWLIVAVAYRKRRNILKNEMWQLFLVTVLGVLWDYWTGWCGWSLDFVFPIGALAVLCSVPVIAGVNRLETGEYLFYLIQAGIAGCIPAILVCAGAVGFTAPSVLCGGISFLTLAGLFIFQKKDTLREFRKKLRM